MAQTILGLDIGGANLKAATPDKRAVSVPFPLWKQPDKLPPALAELVAQFPDAEELAVTMTGELCDCFETKRDGVHAIIKAVRFASGGRRIRVWSTDGAFVDSEQAKANHLRVAAANWHALATFAGRYVPEGRAILVDVGSTTTDVIPILDGEPVPQGKTDFDRLTTRELIYAGVRRTPVCAILGLDGAAELFATALDVYLALGMIPEDRDDCDTADGRPATRKYARARLSRMIGGDSETVSEERVQQLAEECHWRQRGRLSQNLSRIGDRLADMTSVVPWVPPDEEIKRMVEFDPEMRSHFIKLQIRFIVSGSGEFLTRQECPNAISLTHELGPEVSACAPAHAVAVLATERPA
ncbi:MAG: H4MPT-linked C1 transfer pathway protein [Planctomycetes bacterium]|nr:H4MPT-linked C1 transfer pathway protein [Planctomycetota bacterium]